MTWSGSGPTRARVVWLVGSLILALPCGCPTDEPTPDPLTATVVTFNTGTTEGIVPGGEPNGGYGEEQAGWSDLYYGDGLAFEAVIADAQAFFTREDPDIVVFQEIFYSGLCPEIDPEFTPGFVCEHWQPGDPTVAQRILGDGWQVACHPGKDDKCAAVNRRFGTFAGCDDDFCLEGLDGGEVEGCGSGSRVARGLIELEVGGTLTVVNVHGSSGLSSDDQGCRHQQFQLVFEDLDGAPAANGDRNLIMGDLNTDPGRLGDADPSAVYFAQQVEQGGFHFVTDVGPDAEPTYALVNIDHVVSDAFEGGCRTPGLTEGDPPVSDIVYFDHRPEVCDVAVP
jgi:hypothetical protein